MICNIQRSGGSAIDAAILSAHDTPISKTGRNTVAGDFDFHTGGSDPFFDSAKNFQ